MSVRRVILTTVVVLLALTEQSTADNAPPITTNEAPEVLPLPSDHVRILTGTGIIIAPSGQRYFLPWQSHILTPEAWERVDTEVRRLQDRETRLAAENKSLRASLEGWRPGWLTIATAVTVGIIGGSYVAYQFTK